MWFLPKRRIYMDYASAPPVRREAIAAMRKAERLVGNPGAIHAEAVAAKKRLEEAREVIAKELACKAREVIFTSGLTEANNLAIIGHAKALERIRRTLAGTHWIVSAIEHPSVLECFAEVERLGGTVEHLKPDAKGMFSESVLAQELRHGTVFVSIGWGNHEIGTVQPLSALSRVIREHEKKNGTTILFHTDAGQAPLYRAPQVHTLGVDLFSIGSNKMYGPHGSGALYMSNRAQIAPIILGGSQERGLRAGTENVALAAGFAAALARAGQERVSEAVRLMDLRDDLWRRVRDQISGVVINGGQSAGGGSSSGGKNALPHLLNISISDIDSEYIVLALDRAGIAISTKSACNEGESMSHVVRAISSDEWRAKNTLRFSLGRETSTKDIYRAAFALATAVKLFREKRMV
ncbi:cysteine desulfurase [Candidatus Kaiserbacteria bacterium]|nr:cysteine desulfurase [Candidatus Kaiserbacteria bacterium]